MSTFAATAASVEKQAHRIAERACNDLLSRHDDIDTRFGEGAAEIWTDHLQQRLLELAASLSAGDHAMFAARLAWSRAAMQARGLSSDDLDASLISLRTALTEHLQGDDLTVALEYLESAEAGLDKALARRLDPALDPGIEFHRLALHYVQTVVAGNVVNGIELIIDAIRHGMTVEDIYLRVLLPAQQEVGRLWHLNELSVAEEHLVSQTTQRVMAMIAGIPVRKADNGYTVVAGSVTGNAHDIGIRAIAYLLELEGWRTIYLGSDIPQVELPRTIETYSADVLMLSISLSSQVAAARRAITNLRAECSHPVKIIVGGNGLAENAMLWQETGADGYAMTAAEAIALAHDMAGRA